MYDKGMVFGSLDCSVTAPIVPILSGTLDRDRMIIRADAGLNDGVRVRISELQIRRPNDIAKKHRGGVGGDTRNNGEVAVEPDAVSDLISIDFRSTWHNYLMGSGTGCLPWRGIGPRYPRWYGPVLHWPGIRNLGHLLHHPSTLQ